MSVERGTAKRLARARREMAIHGVLATNQAEGKKIAKDFNTFQRRLHLMRARIRTLSTPFLRSALKTTASSTTGSETFRLDYAKRRSKAVKDALSDFSSSRQLIADTVLLRLRMSL